MKAITLWPEWAWAFCLLGKDVENRTWAPSLEIDERFAIHAGAEFGGARGRTLPWSAIFDPVAEMAAYSGWKIYYDRDKHMVKGYRVDQHKTFNVKVGSIATSGIVAVTRFVGTLKAGRNIPAQFPWWAEDKIGWATSGTVVLKDPIKCRGQQGLWKLPDAYVAKIETEIEWRI